MPPHRLHVVVRGRVQGVGFRWFAREAARAAGVAGWVRNNADGGVELAAEGSAAALDQLRRSLREGPPGASVTAVEELPPVDEALASPFAILR